MDFSIPKSFKLGATTISVEFIDNVTGEDSHTDGMAFYQRSKIEIKKDPSFSRDYVEFIFFHELVHQILFTMSEDKLRDDERFVNRLATSLHQALKTMEGAQ